MGINWLLRWPTNGDSSFDQKLPIGFAVRGCGLVIDA